MNVPVPPRGEVLTEVTAEDVPHGFDVKISFRGLSARMKIFNSEQRRLCGLEAIAQTLLSDGFTLAELHQALDTMPPPLADVERLDG